MSTRIVYRSLTGRVILTKHINGRALWYDVTIAGGTYGPFPWREALSWYNRHKDADATHRTGFIVRYDSGAFLSNPGLPPLSPAALTMNPAKARQFSTKGAADRAMLEHGVNTVRIRTYTVRGWRRTCARFRKQGYL